MKSERLLECIKTRRSVRAFRPEPVTREIILKCLEAARYAPSAQNIQPWRFVVIDEEPVRESFCKTVFSGPYRATRWAMRAPVLILVCAEKHTLVHGAAAGLQSIPYHVMDIGISGEHLVLQAQALGLGSCWIGWFHVKKAARFFHLPRTVKPLAVIALGYPAATSKPRTRKLKKQEEIFFFNKWKL
ncbi:MAG TPA: hypothetical protein ENN03_01360 [bacterium]|nr:hypothetical protein [bacterium]